MQQDAFASNTRTQLRKVFETLRELMTPVEPQEPPTPPKRPIGFVYPPDNSNMTKGTGKAAVKASRVKKV